MQITHKEAHRLIQFNADEALNAQQKSMLFAHLEECLECCAYAEEIQRVEGILLPVMKQHWSLQPIPLSMDAIYAKVNSKRRTIILDMRSLAICIVFLAFVFSAWQLTLSGRQMSNQLPPVGVPPVPTPSAQATGTKMMLQKDCTSLRYIVQEHDTLDSIAYRFGVAKPEIMAANNMKTENIMSTKEIIIPICNFTPTGTTLATAFSATYTPSLRPITSTPGG